MKALEIKKQTNSFPGMKKLIAVALMIIFYVQLWGNSDQGFIEGTQLYVVANSGLTLRMEPHKNSESLGIVDYGSVVEVLTQPDSVENYERLNWVDGKWLFVEYDGVTGYMFDGYLSDLPMPIYEFERCQLDFDFIYPLESWVDVNLGESETNRVEAGLLTRITQEFIGGEKLVRSQKEDSYKLELYINDIRLMDAYHLLQNMLDTKLRLETFKSESTFIEDREGDLYKVKIDLDNPVEIRKLKSGDVKITIRSDNYACEL